MSLDVKQALDEISKGAEEVKEKVKLLHGKRISLDLDGVLANLHSVVLQEASVKIGKVITSDEITSFLAFKEKYNWTEEENWKLYRDAWERYKYTQIEPYERTIDQDVDLLETFAHVDIVSAHSEKDRVNMESWLRSHGIKCKLVLSGFEPKVNYPYDIYIDDYWKTLKKVTAAGKIGICYNQPWNLKEDVGNSYRIDTLQEATPIVEDVIHSSG